MVAAVLGGNDHFRIHRSDQPDVGMIEGGLELMFDKVEGWAVEYHVVEYRNGMLFEGKNTAC